MQSYPKIFNLTIISLMFFLAACETLNVSAIGTQGQFIKEADEERIWKRCREEQEIIAHSGLIFDDAGLDAYLNGLTAKIIPDNVRATGIKVNVIILKNPMINACTYPNGVIYVNTGLLANIQNEAQLVSVLGHEQTHFINRHTLKQFRNLKNKSAFFATVSMITTTASGLTGAPADFSSLAMYSLISSVNGYSREQEEEADKGGFEALLRNNYPLMESIKVFDIFERDYQEDKNKQRIPYAFLDHPTNQARIKYLKKLCKLYESETNDKNRLSAEDIYRKNTDYLLLENANLDIRASRFSAAERTIERYLQLSPQDARAYYYLGEVFSNRNEKDDQAKAIENYKKAVDLNKAFPFAHRELGLIYYKNKLAAEAEREFAAYLALAPNAEDKKYIILYLDELRKGDKK